MLENHLESTKATNVDLSRSADKEEISIHLDTELLDQIKHLTNDPSKVIETAIRQWLRGERGTDQELARTFDRNPPLPPRGEWND
ncbi:MULTISPECIES: type II toxin-antitoxin system CcdA family antitoxin [Moorena]|uniref:type II toxin-antitoxin system CcdA family antitoxin n=1 Tax=unclassified Moorena TaxID=2683338 RepID=UPI0005C96149|nr:MULTISPECIES: type II toxin-antitoxin system CcdA family antitoxin [Moorena]